MQLQSAMEKPTRTFRGTLAGTGDDLSTQGLSCRVVKLGSSEALLWGTGYRVVGHAHEGSSSASPK